MGAKRTLISKCPLLHLIVHFEKHNKLKSVVKCCKDKGRDALVVQVHSFLSLAICWSPPSESLYVKWIIMRQICRSFRVATSDSQLWLLRGEITSTGENGMLSSSYFNNIKTSLFVRIKRCYMELRYKNARIERSCIVAQWNRVISVRLCSAQKGNRKPCRIGIKHTLLQNFEKTEQPHTSECKWLLLCAALTLNQSWL